MCSSERATWSLIASAVFALGLGASDARPANSDQVTISMLAINTTKAGYDMLIPSFERVYPNITVNINYSPSSEALNQLGATEFAAGNAPDLLATSPGCGALSAAVADALYLCTASAIGLGSLVEKTLVPHRLGGYICGVTRARGRVTARA